MYGEITLVVNAVKTYFSYSDGMLQRHSNPSYSRDISKDNDVPVDKLRVCKAQFLIMRQLLIIPD